MVILPTATPSVPLWKKIYLHARGSLSQRASKENASEWVTVPYKLVEHYRAMAYAIVQTDSIDKSARQFIYNYTQGLEAAATQYLTTHYGPAIFDVNKGLSEGAYQHFYRALAAHQQARLANEFDEWETDLPNKDGDPDS